MAKKRKKEECTSTNRCVSAVLPRLLQQLLLTLVLCALGKHTDTTRSTMLELVQSELIVVQLALLDLLLELVC